MSEADCNYESYGMINLIAEDDFTRPNTEFHVKKKIFKTVNRLPFVI